MSTVSADDACSTCSGPAQQAPKGGRRATVRPCAVVISIEGVVKLGFLPIPASLRSNAEWTDKGYWVNGD